MGWCSIALVGVAMAVGACEKKAPPPPKTDFEAFERKHVAEYRELAKALRADGARSPSAKCRRPIAASTSVRRACGSIARSSMSPW
ncbi:MAG: hypothetical protein ACKV2T_25610 [Kofleriaceae bacterium]